MSFYLFGYPRTGQFSMDKFEGTQSIYIHRLKQGGEDSIPNLAHFSLF